MSSPFTPEPNASGDSGGSLHWDDITPLLIRFYALNLQHYDALCAGNPLKQWLVYLRGYFPQAALQFEQIKRLREPADIQSVLEQSRRALSTDRCAA